MAGVQPPVHDAAPGQLGCQGVGRIVRAGGHAQGRGVDRRQIHRRAQQRHQLRLRQAHGQHGAAGQAGHQPPARGDQRQGVFQREHAGEARRHELADAVPQQGAGRHTPGQPQPCRRVADGEQRGLRQGRAEQRRLCRIVSGVQDGAEVQAEQRLQDVGALRHGLAEHRLVLMQGPPHVGVLRALAGEQEGSPPAGTVGLGGPAILQAQQDLTMARPGDRQAMREASAADLQGVGDVRQGLLRLGRQVGDQARPRLLQPGRAAGGQHQHLMAPRVGWIGRRRSLRQHGVRIGAADAERADGRTARRRAGPGLRPRRDAERAIRQVHRRVGCGEMQRARHGGMLHRQGRLDQPGDAGGRVQMADIALHRAEHAGARRTEHLPQPGELDGVAQRRGRPVRLDIADAGGREGGLRLRRGDAGDLAGDARGGEAHLAGAIIVGRDPRDHGVDVVAIRHRVRQALQQHHAGAAAEHRPAGRRIERPHVPVRGGEAPRLVQVAALLRQGDGGAARQHHVRIAGAQGGTALRDRHQRGGAGGGHRDGRPAQIQLVGDPGREEIRPGAEQGRVAARLVVAGVAQHGVPVRQHVAQAGSCWGCCRRRRRRGRRPWPGRILRTQALPRRSPGTRAAAGPSTRHPAGSCRRTPDRTGRYRPGRAAPPRTPGRRGWRRDRRLATRPAGSGEWIQRRRTGSSRTSRGRRRQAAGQPCR